MPLWSTRPAQSSSVSHWHVQLFRPASLSGWTSLALNHTALFYRGKSALTSVVGELVAVIKVVPDEIWPRFRREAGALLLRRGLPESQWLLRRPARPNAASDGTSLYSWPPLVSGAAFTDAEPWCYACESSPDASVYVNKSFTVCHSSRHAA